MVMGRFDRFKRISDRPRPAAAGGPGQDRLDRLERLAALRRSGAISAEEFERLKSEILDG